MIIKNENTLLAVGMLSITLSILIGSINVESFGFSVSDFVRGILIGISLALNTTFLIRRRRWRSRAHEDPESNTLKIVQGPTLARREAPE
jgi:uncharacterized membrane protein YdfJ with MMPL/SSD domain